MLKHLESIGKVGGQPAEKAKSQQAEASDPGVRPRRGVKLGRVSRVFRSVRAKDLAAQMKKNEGLQRGGSPRKQTKLRRLGGCGLERTFNKV